jgi:hypothetical protein
LFDPNARIFELSGYVETESASHFASRRPMSNRNARDIEREIEPNNCAPPQKAVFHENIGSKLRYRYQFELMRLRVCQQKSFIGLSNCGGIEKDSLPIENIKMSNLKEPEPQLLDGIHGGFAVKDQCPFRRSRVST